MDRHEGEDEDSPRPKSNHSHDVIFLAASESPRQELSKSAMKLFCPSRDPPHAVSAAKTAALSGASPRKRPARPVAGPSAPIAPKPPPWRAATARWRLR
eukprot:2427705-Prymnesium_polylepis.1